MADVFQKALNKASARVHSYGSHDDLSFTKLGGVALKPNSIPVKNRFYKVKQFNAQGTPANSFATAGSYTDIQINDAIQFTTESCWIKIQLTDAGAGCTPPVSPFLLQQWELLANGASLQLERCTAKSLYFTNLPQLDRVHLDDIAPLMRMNPGTYAPSGPVAANQVFEMWIPLLNSMFEQGLYLAAIQGHLTIRLTWAGQACMEAGNLPILNSVVALVGGYEYDAQTNKELRMRWGSNALSFRAHNDIETNISLTAVPNSVFVQKLSGVTGLVPQLYFGYQPATQTGANLRTINDWIDSHQLKDETGSSYTSGRNVTAFENRYLLGPKWFAGRMLTQIPLMSYCFGGDQSAVFAHRQVDGFLIATTNDQIEIVNNGSASGACTLLIMYKHSVLITCDKGVFRVQKS